MTTLKAVPVPLARLEELLHTLPGAPTQLELTEMPGGASTRRFFRVAIGAGHTAVAMYVPDAGTPEEIAKLDERGRRWPFLEVRDLLEEHGVRVPALLADGSAHGFLIVEDLGDHTIAAYLESHPEARERIYVRAVADLARAQRALARLPEPCIVAERAFDHDLLRWEVDHFREWGLEARGVVLTDGERASFDRAAEHLARTIAALPRGFVHRDYQSRNLMVLPGEELAWVDFQDALMGPRVYDLVALLNDSYQTFDDAFVAARLDEFAAHHGLGVEGRREVQREFDLVTVQRKLKDAGRFVFIRHKKGDASYLPFVAPTLAKVRRALDRLGDEPALRDLPAMLDATVPRAR